MSACLTFDNLTLGYESHPAVHHLSGVVEHGSLTAIVGPNGSGKSTLIKGIVGILAPMSGSCTTSTACRIAYLAQQSAIDRSFPADVRDLVALGLWPRRGLLGRVTASDRQAVSSALEAVGLDGFERRPISSLSGGQLQRALFARVLVQDADLILLDEPFNAIDSKTVDELMTVIRSWQGESRTVMVVLHDLDMVRSLFPRSLLLARSALAWGATKDVLTSENIAHAGRFREAWDDNAPWCEHHSASGVGSALRHDGHHHARL